MRQAIKQRGFSLIISLVLLGMMSLYATTSVQTNNTDLKIAYNMKMKQKVRFDVVQGIEQTLNDIDNFNSPSAQTETINDTSVTLHAPECLGSSPAEGYSARAALKPENTHWLVQATATDASSGASVSVYQGVKIRMLTGSCP